MFLGGHSINVTNPQQSYIQNELEQFNKDINVLQDKLKKLIKEKMDQRKSQKKKKKYKRKKRKRKKKKKKDHFWSKLGF